MESLCHFDNNSEMVFFLRDAVSCLEIASERSLNWQSCLTMVIQLTNYEALLKFLCWKHYIVSVWVVIKEYSKAIVEVGVRYVLHTGVINSIIAV